MSIHFTRQKREALQNRAREERILRETNLRKALDYLRDALDSSDWMSSDDIQRLHVAEELLSRELGHPIWNDPKRDECNRQRQEEVRS